MKRFITIFFGFAMFLSFSHQSYGSDFEQALPYSKNVKVIEEGNYIFSGNVSTYNINGLNYFQLRDLGSIMDFSVEYSDDTIYINTGNKSHDQLSGDKDNDSKQAVLSNERLFIDGIEFNNITSYKIDGYNYYSIREICDAIGFPCDWNAKENTIIIEKIFDELHSISIVDDGNFIFNPENIDNLNEILEKNIDGFDKKLFKAQFVNNMVDGKNGYEIFYIPEINGYRFPYSMLVFVEDNKINYSESFDIDDVEKMKSFEDKLLNLNIDKDIEIAKKEATKQVSEEAYIDYQEVIKTIDMEFNLHLHIKTVCVDKSGSGRFVLGYDYEFKQNYNLNDL